MASINPLDHAIAFTGPRRLHPTTCWAGHIPFAMVVVDLLRPDLLVELGTYTGVSYCAFCQAVQELNLKTRCYAIDTWEGDENNGFYGPDVLAELKQHHDLHYQNFSRLMPSTFDNALDEFDDGTIDLLHIDGFHPYEAVKHDFDSWLPKMSERGLMLLHDTNVRMRNYGVWRLWEELKPLYPHFEFTHEHGLGVIATGPRVPDGLLPFFEASEAEADDLRSFFQRLGERFSEPLQNENLLRIREHELYMRTTELNNILDSRAWRWVCRYGRTKMRILQLFQRVGRPEDADLA